MNNIDFLKKRIQEFSDNAIKEVGLIDPSNLEINKFYNSILKFYATPELHHLIYDLNGFEQLTPGDSPFLGAEYNMNDDPIQFSTSLNSFIGNCLLDDGAYFIKWLKLDKKPKKIGDKEFLLPYHNELHNWAYIEATPFEKGGEPIIMADWSESVDGSNQDVVFLNKVVDFALDNHKKYIKRFAKWEEFKKTI